MGFLEQARATLEDIDRQLAERDLLLEKRAKLLEVIALFEGGPAVEVTVAESQEEAVTEAPARRRRPRADNKQILDAAVDYVAREAGTDSPAPTSEILDHLQRNGFTVGGDDPLKALSALLSRSDRVVANGKKGWTIPLGKGVELPLESKAEADFEYAAGPDEDLPPGPDAAADPPHYPVDSEMDPRNYASDPR